MARVLAALRKRLQHKIMEVAPIVAGALVLVAVLSAVAYVIEPHLPTTYRYLLTNVRHGDVAASRTTLRLLFDHYGNASGFLFLVLQIGQVLVAPIPGQILGLLGGSLFGFWNGLLLSVLGLVIGSAIAMGSSRILGRAVVRRFVPAPILSRLDHLGGANGLWSFFLVFLLPVFPDDAICFMAGLTRLPLHRLLLVCALGRLPGTAVLTFVGARVGGDPTQAYLVLGVTMVLALGLWLFSEEVETLLSRSMRIHPARTEV